MRLDGKTALVTGAARGIGAAVARVFAAEGARVALTDVLSGPGQQVREAISTAGGTASFAEPDVTSEPDWRRVIDEVLDRFGGLDILVNNAGIYERNTVEDLDLETWNHVMEVNAASVFLGTKACIPVMRRSGGGSIINIASVASMRGSQWSTAYHASKGAVAVFTRSAAVQYGRYGIRVNSVHPGAIDTDMLDQVYLDDDLRRQRIEAMPMRRSGSPEEVAKAVLFLASDDSSYVTGAELRVDGGALA
ncbi:MAG: SDR family NAD(P)-dependent oxidoreductase [Chloroflexi bacterium]|nr:SDR family NAD(P)-dependent oxidoreductase [Chloroflexota bacterium]